MNKIDQYYFNLDEPYQSLLLALRDLILSSDLNLKETIKYGVPCFTYRGKILCYNIKDKKGLTYVLFNYGNFLHHPLLQSKGRKLMKSIDVPLNEDIPIESIYEVLAQGKKHIETLFK